MKRSAFGRWGWHWPYWIIIASLAVWIWMQERQDFDRILIPVLNDGLDNGDRLIERYSEDLLRDIDRNVNAYPTAAGKELSRQAQAALRLQAEIDRQSEAWEYRMARQGEPDSSLLHLLTAWRDSIKAWTNGDLPVSDHSTPASLDQLFNLLRSRHFWQHAPEAEKRAAFRALRVQAAAMTGDFLFFSASQMGCYNFHLDQYYPVISFTSLAPRIGELFEAEIFLAAADCHPYLNSIQFRINGEDLPIRDGVGIFKKSFSEAGEKTLESEITVTNPLTKEEKTYTRDFKIQVMEAFEKTQ